MGKRSAQKWKIATRVRALQSDFLLRMYNALGETLGKHIFSILVILEQKYILRMQQILSSELQNISVLLCYPLRKMCQENKNLSPSESSNVSGPLQWSRLSHYERSESEEWCSSFLGDDTPSCEDQTHDSSHRAHGAQEHLSEFRTLCCSNSGPIAPSAHSLCTDGFGSTHSSGSQTRSPRPLLCL